MPQTTPRPYFLPTDFDFQALPEPVQVALTAIIQPAYDELVLQAPNALERAAGATFVHVLFLELLEQFELGRDVAERLTQRSGDASPRETNLNQLLRLLSAKAKAGGFLLRVRALRPQPAPVDPFSHLTAE